MTVDARIVGEQAQAPEKVLSLLRERWGAPEAWCEVLQVSASPRVSGRGPQPGGSWAGVEETKSRSPQPCSLHLPECSFPSQGRAAKCWY